MTKKGFLAPVILLALLLGGCGDPTIVYKGMVLTRVNPRRVTDKDVTLFLDGIRAQAARGTPLDPGTPIARGNRAIIDFVGTIDGTPFEGGSGSAYPIVLGSEQMIPGFESGIVGMRTGETRNVPAKFPADYTHPQLAGKRAIFRITLRGAQALELPPLTAEFAAQVTGGRITSLSELRKTVRAQLDADSIQQTQMQIRMQITELLLPQWKKQPSGREIDREVDRMIQQRIQMNIQRGMKADLAAQSAEGQRPSLRPSAARNLVFAKIISVIAKKERINPTDADIEQAITEMARSQGQDPAALANYLRESKLMDAFRSRVIEDRVLALILENATFGTQPGMAPVAAPAAPR